VNALLGVDLPHPLAAFKVGQPAESNGHACKREHAAGRFQKIPAACIRGTFVPIAIV
jgi:hypothetical protein